MKTTEQGIERVVVGLIAETLGLRQSLIEQDSRLRNDLGADSLDTLEIVTTVEGIYGFDLSAKDLNEIVTVGDIYRSVNVYKGKGLVL